MVYVRHLVLASARRAWCGKAHGAGMWRRQTKPSRGEKRGEAAGYGQQSVRIANLRGWRRRRACKVWEGRTACGNVTPLASGLHVPLGIRQSGLFVKNFFNPRCIFDRILTESSFWATNFGTLPAEGETSQDRTWPTRGHGEAVGCAHSRCIGLASARAMGTGMGMGDRQKNRWEDSTSRPRSALTGHFRAPYFGS
jgi:hypothetical protein